VEVLARRCRSDHGSLLHLMIGEAAACSDSVEVTSSAAVAGNDGGRQPVNAGSGAAPPRCHQT